MHVCTYQMCKELLHGRSLGVNMKLANYALINVIISVCFAGKLNQGKQYSNFCPYYYTVPQI